MSSPVESLAGALALTVVPRAEHGASMLLSGATRGVRRATLDGILASLAVRGGPVVARINARPAVGRFAEELSAAVESALQGIHAPGGLYDDRADEATRSLGGWLFRARTVGRQGVVIAVDELDGWLDVRGAKKSGQDLLRGITTLLGETLRRSVSVVATARAGEASGRPALPADLVRLFGDLWVLGGSPSVTRDPGTLVAAVAGRTFSLSSLKDATEGWLDLPAPAPDHDPDDTLIVFTSPLALPVLDPGEIDWEGSVGRGASVSTVPPAPHDDAALRSRDVRADSQRWSDAVRTALQVAASVRTIREIKSLSDTREAEGIYLESVAPLALRLAALAEGEAAVGTSPTGIGKAAWEAMARFDRMFRAMYAARAQAWVGGAQRPRMLCDLPHRLRELAGDTGARGTAVVLVTGLRWDLWRRFQQRVLAQVSGLTLVEEGVHWVPPPGTVGSQRELVASGGRLAVGPVGEDLANPMPRTLGEAMKPRREHLGSVEVSRLWAYATALCTAESSLDVAARGVEDALPSVLRAICGGFAERTAVLLASDVGAAGSVDAGGVAGGWTLGGDSAAAVVVPYALLTWA